MNRITIIMPIHTTPLRFLTRSFASIKNQKCKMFDLILIINGENKNCNKIEEVFRNESNTSIIKLKHNVGYCWARQMGINKAKTKYIAFLDSDDEISSDYIETFYKHTDVSDFDLIFIRFLLIKEGEIKERKEKIDKCKNSFLVNKISSNKLLWFPAGWSKIINKDFLGVNNIKFIKDKNNIIEDLFFHLCILYKFHKGLFIGEKIMYKYYVHDNSTINELIKSGNSSNIVLANWLEFYKKYSDEKNIMLFIIKTFLFSRQYPGDLYRFLKKTKTNYFLNCLVIIIYIPFLVLVVLKKRLSK